MENSPFRSEIFLSRWNSYQLSSVNPNKLEDQIFARFKFPCNHFDYYLHIFRFDPKIEVVFALISLNGVFMINENQTQKVYELTVSACESDQCLTCGTYMVLDKSFIPND